MNRCNISDLIAAVQNNLTTEGVDVDDIDAACREVLMFARYQEVKIAFSEKGSLRFVSGGESGEATGIRKGIFRTFCARLAVLGSEGQNLPPLYGGPLLFKEAKGTLVNTPQEQSVVLGPIGA